MWRKSKEREEPPIQIGRTVKFGKWTYVSFEPIQTTQSELIEAPVAEGEQAAVLDLAPKLEDRRRRQVVEDYIKGHVVYLEDMILPPVA